MRWQRLSEPHPLGPASCDAPLRRSSARRLPGANALQSSKCGQIAGVLARLAHFKTHVAKTPTPRREAETQEPPRLQGFLRWS